MADLDLTAAIEAAAKVLAYEAEEEIREALADLLGGMAGGVCHLDDASRAIPPSDDQAESGAKAVDQ